VKRVLVIEDEEHLRSDLITVLGFEGYEAIGAENGQQGVLMAQQLLPDLIICDVNMPVLDGFEVITELRDDPQTADIPIIFMTAQIEPAAIDEGLRLGAVAYLCKPIELIDILTVVRAHIG